jgi:hypothetical protein
MCNEKINEKMKKVDLDEVMRELEECEEKKEDE